MDIIVDAAPPSVAERYTLNEGECAPLISVQSVSPLSLRVIRSEVYIENKGRRHQSA